MQYQHKNKAIDLSIIVPIYNVAPYLERCLISLENQDIPEANFEIICINDGSADNSREIIISLQNKFKNIVLIDQENQGVSIARNVGIERAIGRYLMLVDSDDYVKENSLAFPLKVADKSNAQVAFLGLTVLNDDDSKLIDMMQDVQTPEIYSGIEAYFIAHDNGEYDCDRSVGILFSSDYLNQNGLRYLERVPYLEDGEFISRVLCLAERCIFIGDPFYQRTNRPGSATNSGLMHSARAHIGYILAVRNLKMFQGKLNITFEQKQFLNQPICKYTVLVVASISKPWIRREVVNVKDQLFTLGLGKLSLESVDREFTRLGLIYNQSIYFLILYIFVANLLKSAKLRILRILKHSPA